MQLFKLKLLFEHISISLAYLTHLRSSLGITFVRDSSIQVEAAHFLENEVLVSFEFLLLTDTSFCNGSKLYIMPFGLIVLKERHYFS